MKNLTSKILLAVLSIIPLSLSAQYGWIHTINSPQLGYAAAADANGRLNFGGWFSGATSFNPNHVGDSATCSQGNPFLVQYDSIGNLMWYKHWESNEISYIISVDTDPAGNIYGLGAFSNTLDLDPGTGTTNTPTDEWGIFIFKLDQAGNFIWTKSIQAPIANNGNILPRQIAVNNSGEIVVGGEFWGSFDFDPSTGVQTRSSVGTNRSFFILKLDANGGFSWCSQYDANNNSPNILAGLSISGVGQVYATGQYNGDVDFDPQIGNVISEPSGAAFLLSVNPDGSLDWVKTIAGAYGYDCDVTGSSVVFAGNFTGVTDFDFGTGIQNVNANGMDAYFLKLDNTGGFVWVNYITGDGDQSCRSIDIASNGSLYAAGRFANAISYPNLNYNMTSATTSESFICKLSSSGNFVEQYSLLGSGITTLFNVTHSAAGPTYVGGHYSGEADLNINNNVNNFNSYAGIYNPFTIKLGELNYAGLEEQSTSLVKVYPNPTTGIINLEQIDSNEPLFIIDLSGKIVYQSTQPSKSFSVQHLEAGSYFIQSGTYRAKFIKE